MEKPWGSNPALFPCDCRRGNNPLSRVSAHQIHPPLKSAGPSWGPSAHTPLPTPGGYLATSGDGLGCHTGWGAIGGIWGGPGPTVHRAGSPTPKKDSTARNVCCAAVENPLLSGRVLEPATLNLGFHWVGASLPSGCWHSRAAVSKPLERRASLWTVPGVNCDEGGAQGEAWERLRLSGGTARTLWSRKGAARASGRCGVGGSPAVPSLGWGTSALVRVPSSWNCDTIWPLALRICRIRI